MLDLKFQIPDVRVVAHSNVIDQMKSYCQRHPDAQEACGVLLGRQYDHAFEITDFTRPQKTDLRTRASFQRERDGHVDQAVLKWKESNGLVGYLGEWHTHPEKVPTPSKTDLREMNILAKHNHSFIVLIILGTEMGCCTVIGNGNPAHLLRFTL